MTTFFTQGKLRDVLKIDSNFVLWFVQIRYNTKCEIFNRPTVRNLVKQKVVYCIFNNMEYNVVITHKRLIIIMLYNTWQGLFFSSRIRHIWQLSLWNKISRSNVDLVFCSTFLISSKIQILNSEFIPLHRILLSFLL